MIRRAANATSTSTSTDLPALLLVGTAPSFGAAAAFWLAPGLVGNALYAIAKAILYGVPVLWRLRVDRRPLSLSRPARGGFGLGAALGVLLGGFVLAAWLLVARDMLEPTALQQAVDRARIATKGRFLAASAWLCLVNAPLEEYAFRWFVDSRCRRLLPSVPAAIVSSLIFTAHHVIVLRAFFDWPITLLTSGGVFIGGITWTWLYRRCGSIWPGALSHAITDVAILSIGWHLLFG